MPAEATQIPPENKPKATDLDPRPDLAEDHRDWLAVLVMCRHDKQLFGLLHGLRCGGTRLEVREGKRGPYYRLDYSALLEEWSEDELRREWLEPNRAAITEALRRGLQAKKTVELQMEQEAAREAEREAERARRRAVREPEQVGLRF